MKCTVEGCGLPLEQGDSLFCKYHRENWIEFCKSAGIFDKNISDNEIKQYLSKFRKRGGSTFAV